MRRWARSKEYQNGARTPLSVTGGTSELGFSPAMALLIGPGLLAEWSRSPFCMAVLFWARPRGPITAPALRAAAAAPNNERRLMRSFWSLFCMVEFSLSIRGQGYSTLRHVAAKPVLSGHLLAPAPAKRSTGRTRPRYRSLVSLTIRPRIYVGLSSDALRLRGRAHHASHFRGND